MDLSFVKLDFLMEKNFVSIVGYNRYEGWITKSDFYVGTEYQGYSCFLYKYPVTR